MAGLRMGDVIKNDMAPEKGVSAGVVIALILGGAGCSIPEVSLLNSIFKKPMVVTFVLCILLVAIGTGFAFTLVMP